MQPDGLGLGLVEEVTGDRFLPVRANQLPSVAWREDIVRETFGHITAISLSRHAENDFHGRTIAACCRLNKLGFIHVGFLATQSISTLIWLHKTDCTVVRAGSTATSLKYSR